MMVERQLRELGGGGSGVVLPAAGSSAGLSEEPLSASLEDYLEAILRLQRSSLVARVSEIAEQLSVSRPSVTGALKNLASRGLVVHARYGHATLTQEGVRLALGVERRHLAIRDFLTGVLDIPGDKAEAAACRMEHVLEPDVLSHFVSYAERVEAAHSAEGRPAVGEGERQ
jgi:DtxR family Mn-dependent transcriptional regulator